MSKVMRSVKNVTKGYSSVQVKVREATSNDPWGPTGTQMSEIAQLTYNSSTEFYEIMDMLDKRLNDKGKNWRHVLKALKVLDYCLHEGSELVVTWGKQNVYIIKTLREFIYIDEEGRDVGQNVRVAAKELTTLLLDEERLRAERSDRRTWKSRVTGLEEFAPSHHEPQPRRQHRERHADEDDAEYRLAIEASKYQEEEDRRKRESRQGGNDDDDDLAKAIKLSKEEEELRRRELEESNASSLFDDTPAQTSQPQPTGFNQGYQQGSGVDFFGNPIDQSQMQTQPTGYMQQNPYAGFQTQPTGYQNGYSNGFGQQQPTGFDPYGQQAMQQAFQPQPTGYNPYAQQMQSPQVQSPQPIESPVQAGSNNPWASNQQAQAIRPMQTGSNNPFAQQQAFSRPQAFKAPSMPALSSLPEQKTLSTFNQVQPQQTSFTPPPQQPQRELSEHEQRLNALLAGGDGMDTFGNTGQLRIPAQHTAPGTFVNSAGAGVNRLTADATGNNPFLRQQFTGMPTVSYGGNQMPAATGPAGMNGFGAQGTNNPFGRQQQQTNQGDLIQF
ncbi:putative enth domain-containing protein [Phaeoacremonium minimum UCRPA7]|uniref:Putative enth domain-containing protein n=1 Tax=Phaeoacremonium minimum (strain UCR-PA7) TaxID=1286976 RepID=R8BQZ3_PHAM7|nr:putative enth domain-containing protein [Phaeoacremonium minimum UCRPA7]EOO01793.1 putative enth domain-containing protein [Phaeoacremonium minimum UCRPA7]